MSTIHLNSPDPEKINKTQPVINFLNAMMNKKEAGTMTKEDHLEMIAFTKRNLQIAIEAIVYEKKVLLEKFNHKEPEEIFMFLA